MRQRCALSVLVLTCTCSSAFAATPTLAYPTAGEYRIDTDVVTSFDNVSGLEQRMQTDGATGNVTTTSKAPDGAVVTTVVNGKKPAPWCVKPATSKDMPKSSPFVFQNTKASSNSQFSAVCGSDTVDSAFRMIDARTWEHTMKVQIRANSTATATSPASALAMAAPGMSPAQRAESQKAVAGTPSKAQMDSMKAEMLQAAEEDVRTASSPKEAEAARQSLQALRQQMKGTAVQRTIQVKERWTLLNAVCSSGR